MAKTVDQDVLVRYAVGRLLLFAIRARHAARVLGAMVLGLTFTVFAETPPFEAARQLEQAGQPHEAFLKYLATPGAEYAAAAVGRAKPAEYLDLLRANTNAMPAPAVAVVEGDLLLALGRKEEALASYRRAVPLYGAAGDSSARRATLPVGCLAPRNTTPNLEPRGAGSGHRPQTVIRVAV